MELSQLRTFRVVAETLNFTRAAERLGLTQSAVSHQIKSLETELGEPLFIRAKRGVKLSPAGQAALEHAIRLLDEAEALRERVSGGEHSPAGRVRAAAATQAIVHLFAPLFEAFMRAQPRIDVSFRTTASTDETVADILNGAADVGFASLPVYSPALKIENLFEDELRPRRRPRPPPLRRRPRRPSRSCAARGSSCSSAEGRSAAPPISSSTRSRSSPRSPSSRTTPPSSS